MGIWFSGFVIAGAGFIGGTWEIIQPRHLHCAGGGRGLVSGSSEILELPSFSYMWTLGSGIAP